MGEDDLAEMVVVAEQWQNKHQATIWNCAKDVGTQTALDLCRARSNGDDMAADMLLLVAEVRRLREALKPFADDAAKRSWITNLSEKSGMDELNIGGSGLTNGDLRRAALALKG